MFSLHVVLCLLFKIVFLFCFDCFLKIRTWPFICTQLITYQSLVYIFIKTTIYFSYNVYSACFLLNFFFYFMDIIANQLIPSNDTWLVSRLNSRYFRLKSCINYNGINLKWENYKGTDASLVKNDFNKPASMIINTLPTECDE